MSKSVFHHPNLPAKDIPGQGNTASYPQLPIYIDNRTNTGDSSTYQPRIAVAILSLIGFTLATVCLDLSTHLFPPPSLWSTNPRLCLLEALPSFSIVVFILCPVGIFSTKPKVSLAGAIVTAVFALAMLVSIVFTFRHAIVSKDATMIIQASLLLVQCVFHIINAGFVGTYYWHLAHPVPAKFPMLSPYVN